MRVCAGSFFLGRLVPMYYFINTAARWYKLIHRAATDPAFGAAMKQLPSTMETFNKHCEHLIPRKNTGDSTNYVCFELENQLRSIIENPDNNTPDLVDELVPLKLILTFDGENIYLIDIISSTFYLFIQEFPDQSHRKTSCGRLSVSFYYISIQRSLSLYMCLSARSQL